MISNPHSASPADKKNCVFLTHVLQELRLDCTQNGSRSAFTALFFFLHNTMFPLVNWSVFASLFLHQQNNSFPGAIGSPFALFRSHSSIVAAPTWSSPRWSLFSSSHPWLLLLGKLFLKTSTWPHSGHWLIVVGQSQMNIFNIIYSCRATFSFYTETSQRCNKEVNVYMTLVFADDHLAVRRQFCSFFVLLLHQPLVSCPPSPKGIAQFYRSRPLTDWLVPPHQNLSSASPPMCPLKLN